MNANQKFYCIMSVREIQELLRQAKANHKTHSNSRNKNHTVSLFMRGASDTEGTKNSEGSYQVNWTGFIRS